MGLPILEFARPLWHSGTSGSALVLIHGFTGHPGHWEPMADFLAAKGHTVVAPRLPGHGTSPADLASATAEQWVASTLGAAVAVADHRHVHLIGLSMGAMLAILAARPTAATSLTAINPPIRVRDRKVALAPLARHFLTELDAQPSDSPDPDLAHLWSPYPVHPVGAVAELVKVVRRGWREAGRLRRPALVVQSRSDEVVRPVSGSLLAHRLRAELRWLEETRHNALLDPSRTSLHDLMSAHILAAEG